MYDIDTDFKTKEFNSDYIKMLSTVLLMKKTPPKHSAAKNVKGKTIITTKKDANVIPIKNKGVASSPLNPLSTVIAVKWSLMKKSVLP